ncbi:MAG: SpoIID/LytB domain-containing protein [Candidatus Omnitrophica bacterium]|nr:SpoIID/LytB domain-containing protein [Candidatus Omnitrophota bacterium]MBI2174761.1 SpoIID/LytB domain-containing protein [Candidatus Omnitrophota bacterium]
MRHKPIYGIFLLVAAVFCKSLWAAAPVSLDLIRVAVIRNDPEVQLQVFGRFTVIATQTGKAIHQGRRMAPTAVRGVRQGLVLGERVVPFNQIRVEPASDAAISVNGKRLRGTLEIVRQQDLTLLVINHLPLEDYLRGVLSKEAPDYWPEEALKAIAIAARTYAVYQMLSKLDAGFDVTGDVLSQDYGGKSGEKHPTTRAVKATRGLVLTYKGELFPAFYHSTCGGMTEHSRVMGSFDIPPLSGGTFCQFCAGSPFYSWSRRLTKEDLNWALYKSPYGTIGTIRALRINKRTPSGRIETITIVGERRTLTMTAYEFRALLGFDRIRSPLFYIEPDGEKAFLLHGHGWGHGVGLCQWGSSELARRGVLANEILAFYYPQSNIQYLRELGIQRSITKGDVP